MGYSGKMKTETKNYLKLLCILCFLQSQLFSSEAIKVFNNRVQFKIPGHWKQTKKKNTKNLVQYLYQIPMKSDKGAKHPASAVINVRKIPDTADMSYADTLVYSKKLPGYSVINNSADNEFWKTYLWAAQLDKTPYVGLQRIGISKGILCEFLVSYPLLSHPSENKALLAIDTSVQKTKTRLGVFVNLDESLDIVRQFNMVCESMDIDSTGAFRTPIVFYGYIHKDTKFFRPKIKKDSLAPAPAE
jgi:hypothetical protein